jgi:hypothetical protein
MVGMRPVYSGVYTTSLKAHTDRTRFGNATRIFNLFLKTENSRRVAESRPVCVGLKPGLGLTSDKVFEV